MTVYVVNEVRDDLSAAHKFGRIEYINSYYVHGDELVQQLPLEAETDVYDWTIPPGYMANMHRIVQLFNPGVDYLLIAGDHLQLLAMSALLASWCDSFMVLRYDRKILDYIPVRLYSGLVPGSPRVVRSPHIGEKRHGQDRSKD